MENEEIKKPMDQEKPQVNKDIEMAKVALDTLEAKKQAMNEMQQRQKDHFIKIGGAE